MEYERIILQTIEEILNILKFPPTNIDLEPITDKDGNGYRVNIECDEPNHLIGKQGETLKALEHIIKLIFRKRLNIGDGETPRLELDIQNYRKKQIGNVIELTEQKARTARETHKAQTLPPMSGYLRRVIHLHITQSEYKDLETFSVGNGHDRQVTIQPKKQLYG